MPSITIDDTGGRADWSVRAGTVWEADLTIELAADTPEDITSATITAAVFADASSTSPLRTFTVTKPDPVNGRCRLRITAPNATLTAGPYRWASEIDTGNGPEPLLWGEFTVAPWNFA